MVETGTSLSYVFSAQGTLMTKYPPGLRTRRHVASAPQRIGEVLQHVERHDNVVGSVGDVLEAPSVADAQPPQEAAVHVEGGPARRFRSNRLDARYGSILFRPVDDVHGRPGELCVQATDVRRGAANLQRARVPRQSDYFLLKRLQRRGARGDTTAAQGQDIGIVGTRTAKRAAHCWYRGQQDGSVPSHPKAALLEALSSACSTGTCGALADGIKRSNLIYAGALINAP